MHLQLDLRCEWNPKHNKLSSIPRSDGDCLNQATLGIGTNGPAFLLCAECAKLPRLARYRHRELLEDIASGGRRP